MRLENKVAMITGAGSGIGKQTAYLFAKEGARLVLTGKTSFHIFYFGNVAHLKNCFPTISIF